MAATNTLDLPRRPRPDLDPSWRQRAACRGVDPELFFLVRGDGRSNGAVAARAVCAGCVVRADYLDYAVEAGESVGIWGGLTEKELRAVRKARRAARARAERLAEILVWLEGVGAA